MIDYIVRRLLLVVPTLFMVTLIVFFSLRFVPGSVIDIMVAEMEVQSSASELTAETLRHQLGLDVPIYVQYGRWIGVLPNEDGRISGILEGNFGKSLWRGRPVLEDLQRRLPVSFELGLLALIVKVTFAIPLGTYSAIRQDTVGDYGSRTFAILCISLPSFWVATMVMVYPSIYFGWTPSMAYIPIASDPLRNLGMFLIPAALMGLHSTGATMRMTRTMMLEVLRQDYIRTAWSKGLDERTIIIRHALKNALIPVITVIGLQIPILIGGSVIMENIFNLPGIGQLLLQAITQRDYPVVSAINVVMACFILIINLVVDLAYGWLDPRVSYK